MPRDALIVGLGLIGGSIGIALRRHGWRVSYLDPHVSDPRDAADRRVDSIVTADVTVLATPVDVAVATLPLEGVATSVCSVMKPLRDAARGHFVAGHPMAGLHLTGLAHADGNLFAGKPWFLDAEEPLVDELVRDCGGVIERVDAAEHDAAVALTSHLPQVLSTALAAYLEEKDVLRFAGSGLRDFLRLAGSDASVWKPILEANRANIPLDELMLVAREIVEGDPTVAFEKARRVFDRLK
jgi:prephenate dehydrogenase